jgi:hypothetical protein
MIECANRMFEKDIFKRYFSVKKDIFGKYLFGCSRILEISKNLGKLPAAKE